jgi:hypothetical protein
VVLTPADGGAVSAPAFDDEGLQLAFARGGAEPGIWLIAAGDPASARRLTSEASDTRPVFLKDGSLLFTRTVDGQPFVHRVREGEPATPAMTDARRTVDVDRGSGRVLLRSADDRYFYWWNPEDRLETTGPPTFAPNSNHTHSIALSPDGAWSIYRAGPAGDEIWRTAQGLWQPIRIALPADAPISATAITDDGHVLAVTSARRGELWRLDAPPTGPW